MLVSPLTAFLLNSFIGHGKAYVFFIQVRLFCQPRFRLIESIENGMQIFNVMAMTIGAITTLIVVAARQFNRKAAKPIRKPSHDHCERSRNIR